MKIVVTVENRLGMHARPATLFAALAQKFSSRIKVSCRGETAVDGKSVIGLLMLAAAKGTDLTVSASGADAAAALEALGTLVKNRFDE